MNEIIKCCFTGYRPQKFDFEFADSNKDYLRMENKLTDAIFSFPKGSSLVFYCGMAMGFDILAGEIVCDLKKIALGADVRLVAAVPFPSQSENFPENWKKRYEKLLSNADEIEYISDSYSKSCFMKRNRFMVDNSDIVITWFDGSPGGTAATIAYAEKKNKRIVNLALDGVHEYDAYDYIGQIKPSR